MTTVSDRSPPHRIDLLRLVQFDAPSYPGPAGPQRTRHLPARHGLNNVPILLANSAQAASRANRDVRVPARGTPSSQSEARLRLIAAAVATCCKWVFASPRYRDRRR